MYERLEKTPVQELIEALETPTIEYIWDGKKESGRKKRGVLIASVQYGHVLIGFSICHKTLDRFDYVDGIHKPGRGLECAIARSEKWADWKKAFVVEPNRKKAGKKAVPIPSLMSTEIEEFIGKCTTLNRYKKKNFPEWAMDLLAFNSDVIDFDKGDAHIETKVVEPMQTQIQP